MKNKRRLRVQSLGFYLNEKFEIHLLIASVINIVALIVVIGLFELFKYPLIMYEDVMGIIIFSVASTMILESIKVFVLRHFIDILLKTFGILFLATNMLTFYLTTLLITDVYFYSNILLKLFIFTLIFSLIKLLLIILFQRITVKDEKEEGNYEELD